jgi:hypothetical protein
MIEDGIIKTNKFLKDIGIIRKSSGGRILNKNKPKLHIAVAPYTEHFLSTSARRYSVACKYSTSCNLNTETEEGTPQCTSIQMVKFAPVFLFLLISPFFEIIVSLISEHRLDFNVVAICGHKTGTVMMIRIFHRLAALYSTKATLLARWEQMNKKKYQFYYTHSYFELLKHNRSITPYRGFFLVRHPLDIFISAMRYNKISIEPWLHELRPLGSLSKNTFHNYLNTLSPDDGILLEMTCSGTVTEMVETILRTRRQKNLKIFKLHHFKLSFLKTIQQLASHLQVDHQLLLTAASNSSYDNFMVLERNHSSIDEERSQQLRHISYEYPFELTCVHYYHFLRLHGLKSLLVTGFNDTIDEFFKNQKKACGETLIPSRQEILRSEQCTCWTNSDRCTWNSNCVTRCRLNSRVTQLNPTKPFR